MCRRRIGQAGSTVVGIVDAAFRALRAERDTARTLLTDVVNEVGPLLPPSLTERINRALDGS